jgi:acetyl esterase
MASSNLRARLEKRVATLAMRLPKSWMVQLAGGRRTEVDGFVLDEQLQLAIALRERLNKPHTHQLSVDAARLELEASASILAPPPRVLDRIEERKIPGPDGAIPIRAYVPLAVRRPSAALVFYHGGGFALGSLASHDGPCRVLADEAGLVVIAVDYRLAPEHRFPAAVDDAVAAFRWVAANAASLGIDPRRIGVGGDSAGGNLAAVVAQQTRDDALRPAMQLLIYPATDFTMSAPSHAQMGHGFFLEHETMLWFRDHYLRGPEDVRDPRASPLFADDLRDLPPAYVCTAGFDPLRDEGEAYANRLREAGNTVVYRCYPSLFHGFISAAGGIDAARPTLTEAAGALRDMLR